jgi:enamine deaminase RidA (YjgF/YER057c/UK114 family)
MSQVGKSPAVVSCTAQGCLAMERQLVSSGNTMEESVGYCRAVRVGERVWVSGTAPVWPDGSVDPDPGAQARRCLEIIGAALAELGAGFADVVRGRIYAVDADDFGAIAAAYGEVFARIRPALTGVVVAALLDPSWKVEIEVDAVVGSAAR